MLKYLNTQVTFAEVPNEITLCINITNCPCHCKGCHSPYLAEDTGKPLNWESLNALIHINRGITCVAFMGGDIDPSTINKLASNVRRLGIKTAWYSGRQELSDKIDLCNFNFIKLGPYNEELGPLNSKTTNQRFYKVFDFSNGTSKLIDWTYKFWKDEVKD